MITRYSMLRQGLTPRDSGWISPEGKFYDIGNYTSHWELAEHLVEDLKIPFEKSSFWSLLKLGWIRVVGSSGTLPTLSIQFEGDLDKAKSLIRSAYPDFFGKIHADKDNWYSGGNFFQGNIDNFFKWNGTKDVEEGVERFSKLKKSVNRDFTGSKKEVIPSLIERIKTKLYKDEGFDSWEEFVDNQDIGNCQSIVSSIIQDFPQVKKCFGEIEVEEPYIDDEGEEQNLMTHHWVKIKGVPFDFSKGTLKDYIQFQDIYSPEIEDDSIYSEF